MESYEQCGQGQSYCSLCTLYTIHRFIFVTRLIINKINKVQRVDFKLENVLVFLHFIKIMGLGPFGVSVPLFLKNGELLGHSSIHNVTLNVSTGEIPGYGYVPEPKPPRLPPSGFVFSNIFNCFGLQSELTV